MKHLVRIPNERLFIPSSSCAVVTTPSPPGHGRCSRRRDPRALTEPAQWCECCGQRKWQTPPSEGSEVFPLPSARGGVLNGEASYNGFLLLIVAAVHIYSKAHTSFTCTCIPSSSTFWSGISVWGSPTGGAGGLSSSSSSSVGQKVNYVKHDIRCP